MRLTAFLFVREPCALACVGLGESLWLPGSAADWKVKSLSCVANESGSQRARKVRRWLEPSLLNGVLAERRGLDRFDIGIGIGIRHLRLVCYTIINKNSYLCTIQLFP